MTQSNQTDLMTDASVDLLREEQRSNWIRLRTLVVLRWIAIAGQIVAIYVAEYHLGLELETGACLAAIGSSVVANLVAIFVYPESKRLSESEVTSMLLFDTAQLSALLALTGGLQNPFALLLLAPVTVSATALQLRSTLIIGGSAIALASVVSRFYLPLVTEAGAALVMPPLFVFGFWTAIVIGVVFVSAYARRVSLETHSMAEALLATQIALAREQKLTDLGGVVAAAAHELGTPLATIKLTSAELIEDLADRPELLEDAILIRDQADRCRDILRSMGRAGKSDSYIRQAPVTTVIREAAEPHMSRGKAIFVGITGPGKSEAHQPIINRRPEIIHGLRNLIQNAVDFAATSVWVDVDWSDEILRLRISDDGSGFPPHVIGRLGDPFLRRRSLTDLARPEYEGMGLGLFIAKTLLERTGAEMDFMNGTGSDHVDGGVGAVVTVQWPLRSAVFASKSPPLEENRPITP